MLLVLIAISIMFIAGCHDCEEGETQCDNTFSQEIPCAAGEWDYENAIDCEYGCNGNVCMTNRTCTDSDGGLNYYVKGFVKDQYTSQFPNGSIPDTCETKNIPDNGNTNFVDSCSGSNCFVREYYCVGDNHDSNSFQCPNGCSNGACIQSCGMIHEGTKNYSKSINFIIIPADTLYGDFLNDSNAQYSNNTDVFVADAKNLINDFLAVDPIDKYKDNLNFYYSAAEAVNCALPDPTGTVVCKLWKENADNCSIPYDEVIILQRKPRGGLWGGPLIQSGLSSIDFTHEVGHYLGLRDVHNYYNLPSPNLCTNLDCCGGTVCQVQDWCSFNRIESGGPNCCFDIGSIFSMQNNSFYIPNEYTVYYGCDETVPYFNHLERAYLNEFFEMLSSSGKESLRCGPFFRTPYYCLIPE